MGKQKDTSLDRRDFIKHAVAGTTALTASSSLAADQAARWRRSLTQGLPTTVRAKPKS